MTEPDFKWDGKEVRKLTPQDIEGFIGTEGDKYPPIVQMMRDGEFDAIYEVK